MSNTPVTFISAFRPFKIRVTSEQLRLIDQMLVEERVISPNGGSWTEYVNTPVEGSYRPILFTEIQEVNAAAILFVLYEVADGTTSRAVAEPCYYISREKKLTRLGPAQVKSAKYRYGGQIQKHWLYKKLAALLE